MKTKLQYTSALMPAAIAVVIMVVGFYSWKSHNDYEKGLIAQVHQLMLITAKHSNAGVKIRNDPYYHHEKTITAFTPISLGEDFWEITVTEPYAAVADPIHKNAMTTFGFAGLIVLLFAAGGIFLFKTQKEKAVLEERSKYVDEIAATAEALRRYVVEIAATAEALRQSEERLQKLSEATVEGVALIGNGKILASNEVFARMFGYDFAEVDGMEVLDVVAPQYRDLALKQMSSSNEEPYELMCIKKDGTTLPVEACGKAVSYQGRLVKQTALRDLSERKQAEQERIRHEKLQGVLEMAGAVCHEINQPMQIISGYSDLLLGEISKDSSIYEDLNILKGQVVKMSEITDKLMKITQYKTCEYIEGRKIIDIHKASKEMEAA